MAAATICHAECARLRAEHPHCVAIVAELADTGKVHFLALPRDATVAQLEAAVRRASAATVPGMALTVQGCAPAAATTVGDLADAATSADGLLHVTVGGKLVLGNLGSINIPCVQCP
ncbi:hypothetical protein NESM_000932100 [Novymonas esmeraldas]|uniref:Uncharacterized protein n=1 Tax=Novymonas esmeraldas TaxID=1808958 RepID=A0AAW0F030_9TRYP